MKIKVKQRFRHFQVFLQGEGTQDLQAPFRCKTDGAAREWFEVQCTDRNWEPEYAK